MRRTLKLLFAIARGEWIVGEDFVHACALARGPVDPAAYELFESIPGCRVSRLAAGRALAGLMVTVRGATAIPHPDLCDLLRAAGANIVGVGAILVEGQGWKAKLGEADSALVSSLGTIPLFRPAADGSWAEDWNC